MVTIIMPQVGQDLETAVVVEWAKQEGESVSAGEVIVTVESEKACFEVEAEASGVLLRILHPVGAEVPIFTPLGYIGQPHEEIPLAESQHG